MNIDDIEAAANEQLFGAMSIAGSVTLLSGNVVPARIIIDRDATITDNFGIVLESRCEIGLLISEVGDVSRGTVVDTGKTDDVWVLLDPIGNDGYETRWTATQQ